MQTVAIIPARGGSKRIPGKNIKEFKGKPIIAWSIDAALSSGCFDRVVVSTDDPVIADIARKYGAEVPFMRSKELSDDYTPTIPVVRDAVNQCIKTGQDIDYVCCIYATAPFLMAATLGKAFDLLKDKKDIDFVFAGVRFSFPIWRSFGLTEEGECKMFWPENELKRSQDLQAAYHDAGQFYFGTKKAFMENDGVFTARSHIIEFPSYLVQDIDTIDDWERAEVLFDVIKR
jgi:pseudaminic acid cytidylyltransferase